MIALFQVASDVKEIVTIESVSAIGVLLLFITYLIWQNHLLKSDVKDLNGKITEIITEHKEDLKNGNKDIISMIAKYHTFVEQLSSLRNERNYRG